MESICSYSLGVLHPRYRSARFLFNSQQALVSARSFECTGIPTQTQIATITELPHAVLRNLLITQTYHQLSIALREMLGIANANWCTFATWASKQAGRSIRGEDLPDRVHQALAEHPGHVDAHTQLRLALLERFEVELVEHFHLTEHVPHLMSRLSAAIAEGNLRVFAELAPLFARFSELPLDGGILEKVAFDEFLDEIRPGAVEDDGQDLLRVAFINYRDAMQEPRQKHKIELILEANVLIGLHEQTRLQPNISEGLETPAHVVEQVVETVVRRIADVLPFHHHHHIAPVATPHAGKLGEALVHVWCREATDHIMTLAMPEMVLHLGHDLPALPGGRMFPEGLEELERAELIALAREYDHSWNSTVGCGASDWTSLADRMHFIFDLFRSRHFDHTLHHPPFSNAQLSELEAGRVAAHPL